MQKIIPALNQLLSEELIVGREVDDVPPKNFGGQSICYYLNTKKIKEVREELNVWYLDPRFIIPAVIGLAGLVWAVTKIFI